MSVDYAVPDLVQTREPVFAIPATTGAIVPYVPPVASQPVAPVNSSSVAERIVPSTPRFQSNIRESGSISGNSFGTSNLKPSSTTENSIKANSLLGANPYLVNDKGVGYGKYPAPVSESDVQSTLVIGTFIVGFFDQASGVNTTQNNNNERRERQRNNVFTPAENLAYDFGRHTANGLDEIIDDAKESIRRTRDDIWKHRPTFEIPQIKIPQFDLPEIPKINIPEIPGFKFPEISFPRIEPPKPQPKPKVKIPQGRLIDKLRETDMLVPHCGQVQVLMILSRKVTGIEYTQSPNGGTIQTLVSIEADPFNTLKLLHNQYKKVYPDVSLEDFLTNSGDGYEEISYNENGTLYRIAPSFFPNINDDGSGGYYDENGYAADIRYPFYTFRKALLTLSYGSLGTALSQWASGGYDAFSYQVAFPNKEGCYIPQPEETPPPTPPKKKECECDMSCCPEIDYRLMKRLMVEALKEQKFSIDVPVVKCEFDEVNKEWKAKVSDVTLDFFATSKEQALQMAELHKQNAVQAAELCVARNVDNEAIAAIPLSWQIRHEGKIPQMVIQCAVETVEEGKKTYGSAMYPITVPHWTGGSTNKPSLPAYKKGNYEGILVLADNTKVTINSANEAECLKILNAIKPWIKKEMLEGSYFKGGKLNTKIKVQTVKPMYGRYFGEGQRNGKPDWRVDFP